MAKFKVNENVVRVSDGKIGTIKAREITQMSDSDSTKQSTNVKYLVDFGEGIENWSVVTRNDIQKIQRPKSDPYIVKNYNIDESKSLTIVALVEKTTKFVYDMDGLYAAKKTHGKKLSIGFSIYNGSDVYDNEDKYSIQSTSLNSSTQDKNDFPTTLACVSCLVLVFIAYGILAFI